MIKKSDAEIDAFLAEMREVGESESHDPQLGSSEFIRAVRVIIRGFHEGVFVRSVNDDLRPDWAFRVYPYLRALAIAQEHVGDQCLGEDCSIHGGPNPEGS